MLYSCTHMTRGASKGQTSLTIYDSYWQQYCLYKAHKFHIIKPILPVTDKIRFLTRSSYLTETDAFHYF